MPDSRKFNRLLREHGEKNSRSSLGEGILPFPDVASEMGFVNTREWEDEVRDLLKGGKTKLDLRRGMFIVRTRAHEFSFPMFPDPELEEGITVKDLKSGNEEMWRGGPDGYEGPF